MPEHRFPTPLPLELVVNIPSGDVEVDTVDGAETFVEVGGSDELVERTEVRHEGDRVVVDFKHKLGVSLSSGRGLVVRVRLPHGADVRIATAAADAVVRGRVRSLDAKTASGDVEVRGGVEQDAAIKTVSGDARIDRVGGDLVLQSVSGDLTAGAIGGSVDTKSVSGDIRIESLRDGRASFTSVSGDVAVGIAQGSFLDVDAGSVSGDLGSEVPLSSDRSGAGEGPTVVLRGRSVSGDVRVFRTA